ncbi:MAG: N-acetyltransferase [marine benthic group bacterium]|nr:N-acetyltransferase [Candidatus Carthagonibacter metallireducens]
MSRVSDRIEVVPADGRRRFRDFLHLPYAIYEGDPNWVAPLLRDVKTAFDKKKHPFHRHSEVQPYVAYRDGRPAGRIAAINNRNHVAYHEEPVGFFGYFESENDPEVAGALFDTAAEWLRERNLETMRGPTSFSLNEMAGLLVMGFDRPPTVMMPYNPEYYVDLVEGAGFERVQSLIAYHLPHSVPPEKLIKLESRLEKRLGVRTRTIDMAHFEEELERLRVLYNKAWEKNWGFVPMTDAEIDFMAHELKPLVKRIPTQVIFAERDDGEVIGFTLFLMDANQALIHARGRLLPFGLFKILKYLPKMDYCRVLTLGLVPEARGQGIDNLLIMALFRHGAAAGTIGGEFSWILEDNAAMRKPLERIGSEISKRYLLYDRPT